MSKNITINQLKEILDYDKNTGNFIWKIPPKCHQRLLNQKAGSIKSGYEVIKINRKPYKAHRLAWAFCYNSFPEKQIDHINGNPLDNRICNLRMCTNTQNQYNKRNFKNKNLPKCVRKLPSGKYQVRITVGKNTISLGSYEDLNIAIYIHNEAIIKAHGEFARSN